MLLEQIKHTKKKCLNVEALHNDKRRLYYRPHNCGTDIIFIYLFLNRDWKQGYILVQVDDLCS